MGFKQKIGSGLRRAVSTVGAIAAPFSGMLSSENSYMPVSVEARVKAFVPSLQKSDQIVALAGAIMDTPEEIILIVSEDTLLAPGEIEKIKSNPGGEQERARERFSEKKFREFGDDLTRHAFNLHHAGRFQEWPELIDSFLAAARGLRSETFINYRFNLMHAVVGAVRETVNNRRELGQDFSLAVLVADKVSQERAFYRSRSNSSGEDAAGLSVFKP